MNRNDRLYVLQCKALIDQANLESLPVAWGRHQGSLLGADFFIRKSGLGLIALQNDTTAFETRLAR